jgi:uncharacterized protein (DUF58 family)
MAASGGRAGGSGGATDGGVESARDLLKALRRIEITTARLANERLSGNYASAVKGQGLAFREVRPYQRGDDVRAIDWNVSARMNEAYVKVFVEEREMTVMLAVDVSASQRFGSGRASKARVAAEVAALCTFSAVHNGDRVGLVLSTDRVEKIVPPKRGDKHAMRIVREVLGFRPGRAGTDLGCALEALVRVARRRSVAFVVSDFFARGYERPLALAAAKHDVVPVVLVDRRDDDLPATGLTAFEDFETGESVVVDTSDRRVRAWYAHQMRLFRAARDQTFRKLGLDVVRVDTAGDYVAPLRDLFARRARRARR